MLGDTSNRKRKSLNGIGMNTLKTGKVLENQPFS